jgi:hypothetical protein
MRNFAFIFLNASLLAWPLYAVAPDDYIPLPPPPASAMMVEGRVEAIEDDSHFLLQTPEGKTIAVQFPYANRLQPGFAVRVEGATPAANGSLAADRVFRINDAVTAGAAPVTPVAAAAPVEAVASEDVPPQPAPAAAPNAGQNKPEDENAAADAALEKQQPPLTPQESGSKIQPMEKEPAEKTDSEQNVPEETEASTPPQSASSQPASSAIEPKKPLPAVGDAYSPEKYRQDLISAREAEQARLEAEKAADLEPNAGPAPKTIPHRDPIRLRKDRGILSRMKQ